VHSYYLIVVGSGERRFAAVPSNLADQKHGCEPFNCLETVTFHDVNSDVLNSIRAEERLSERHPYLQIEAFNFLLLDNTSFSHACAGRVTFSLVNFI
jgi:hypothetical protein